jgi:chromosome partitioning protein
VLIALANPKGGVGKTTIAVQFALLAHERGRSVAFVDCDAQQSGSRWLRGLGTPFPLYRLTNVAEITARLDGILAQAELVIADGPAGYSPVTKALIIASDLALLPCGPSLAELETIPEVVALVREAQKVRADGGPKACLVPNRVPAGARLSREMPEALDSLGLPHLVNGLPQRMAHMEALTQRSAVWRLGRSGEEAAKEFFHLYEEIEHQV